MPATIRFPQSTCLRLNEFYSSKQSFVDFIFLFQFRLLENDLFYENKLFEDRITNIVNETKLFKYAWHDLQMKIANGLIQTARESLETICTDRRYALPLSCGAN